jgi:hypothetical protein
MSYSIDPCFIVPGTIWAEQATYKMDDATFRHLTAWADDYFRPEEAVERRDAIVALLEAMPTDDAEYSLGHGWPHVANLL